MKHGNNDFGWGIIMNFKKEKKDPDDEEYRVDIMVNCDKDTIKSSSSSIAQPAKGKKFYHNHYSFFQKSGLEAKLWTIFLNEPTINLYLLKPFLVHSEKRFKHTFSRQKN